MQQLTAFRALKAQAKRKNFWLISLIVALSVTTLIGLWQINSTLQELQSTERQDDAKLAAQLDRSNDIGAVEVEFKTQVQEWKDVLLRGHDAVLYQKYWHSFEQHERSIRKQLEALQQDYVELERVSGSSGSKLDNFASGVDQEALLQNLQGQSVAKLKLSDQVSMLIVDHVLIGNIYRANLARYPLAQTADNAFKIDQQVRGLDRWLASELSQLREKSVAHQAELTAQANVQQQAQLRSLHKRIQRTIIWVVAIMLGNFLLLMDRLRNSAKDLRAVTQKADAAIYELAYTDGLTGLPNRRLFHDKLDHAIALSRNTGHYGGLIFLDLDNFKSLNDSKGHALGDQLLVEVAQRLKQSVRGSDTVARLGGDEFVVILDALRGDALSASEQAGAVAEKIGSMLAQPYVLKDYTHHGSASIGVALFSQGEVSGEELIKRADTAMYHAKRAGRNTVRFYDRETQEALEARTSLENSLHEALAKQQFALHYQVQVNVHKQVLGAEALLRWNHPELGQLEPAQFIPMAEESGVIHALGDWVLNAACAQLKVWSSAAATREWVLAINVSAVQLRVRAQPSAPRSSRANFVEQVERALATSGINPARLKLEFTESLTLREAETTLATLQELKALGVSLCMDGFGTGHSSLAQLKRLPLDEIKIDRSFVVDIVSDNYDQAIVRSMIDMACSMGMQTVAEGVESLAQYDMLVAQGCQIFQGYLFGTPQTIGVFASSAQGDASASAPPSPV